MSFEVIQKVGTHQYIYLAEGYRNEKGQPRQRRVPIGKIDPVTGQKVYKAEYLAQLESGGDFVMPAGSCRSGRRESKKQFSIADIRGSVLWSYGSHYFLTKVSEHKGLISALVEAFPDAWMLYFTIVCYLISTGDSLFHCEEWQKETETYPVGPLTPGRIGKLLETELGAEWQKESEVYSVGPLTPGGISELSEMVPGAEGQKETEAYSVGPLTPGRISELSEAMPGKEGRKETEAYSAGPLSAGRGAESFYRKWYANRAVGNPVEGNARGLVCLKKDIESGRLPVHGGWVAPGVRLVVFLVSVLTDEICSTMAEHGLDKEYTMEEIFTVLDKQKVQEINGERIVYPVTEAQGRIYEAFGIEVPVGAVFREVEAD